MPLSPSDMTSALEQKIVSGTGFLYPGSDLESATSPSLALLDLSWPDAFLTRIGETISVRISSTTGYYEFIDENGVVFWIEIPVTPLTWNWVAPFLFPFAQSSEDLSLLVPWHLADQWRLSTESLEEQRATPLFRTSLLTRSAPETNDVTELCFTAFTYTSTNLSFTAAWPTNETLPDNVLDLYCSTNKLDRFRFLLSSHPATNSPVSFSIPTALIPNWDCATSHVHDATCPAVTNIVLSPLDGTTLYTNVVYDCPIDTFSSESAFFRLGSRVDTDEDGLSDAYECFVTGSSPNAIDSDFDGLSDFMEADSVGTDPTLPDTDGDGLDDGEETMRLNTNPLAVDTDSDGLSDRTEVGAISAIEYRWIDSGTATNLLANGENEDGIWTFSLSSPFIGDSLPHHRIAIDTNGVVFLLEPGGSVTNIYPVPQSLSTWTNSPAHITVAALWGGLESDSQSALRFFETAGTSVVEFDNFLLSSTNGDGSNLRAVASRRASFQVVLPHTVNDSLDIYYREIPDGGISIGSLVGVHNRDRNYFLLPNQKCTLPRPADPNLDIGSGRGFRFHLGLGTNPLVADSDGDGLNDGNEANSGTNPLETDSDDDGVSDADEIAAGTDPNDSSDSVGYQSGAVLGNGAQGVPVPFQQTFSIPKNTTTLLGIWMASEEFPEYTSTQSEYNDTLHWNISTNGVSLQTGTTNVNALHARFAASSEAGHSIPGMLINSPPVDLAWILLSAPTNQDLSVQLEFTVTNVSDGRLPSTMMAALYPLRVIQQNWPDSKTATDFGVRRPKRILQNGIAYVTGEPAAPELTAQFQNLPEFVEVGWRLDLVSERSERSTNDNRRLPESGWIVKPGNKTWNITETLNEIVGGKNTLSMQINGTPVGDFTHVIRGKNPTDREVYLYIINRLEQQYRRTAYLIFRHESRWGKYVFNQFNPGIERRELPNYGEPDGWGISQIDRTKEKKEITTAEVWDWKTNINAGYEVLKSKFSVALRFISYFRDEYGQAGQWTEPPSELYLQQYPTAVLRSIEWSGAVLYNGANGVPRSVAAGHPFHSPLVFSTENGWEFYDNIKRYAHHIAEEIVWMQNKQQVNE